MKNCIALSILLSLLIQVNAQENTKPIHRISFGLGVNYLFPNSENDLNIAAKETGFLGGLTYSMKYGKMGLSLSPFVKLHAGEDFDGMKQYYKDQNITLTSFNGGTYFSSGMSIGLDIDLLNNGNLPVISSYIQYGISSVRTPALIINADTQNGNIIVRTEQGLAVGSVFNVGVNCDAFKSGNSIYSVKLGVMNENASVLIPTTTFTDAIVKSAEIFPWRSLSAYLSLAIAFDLDY